MTKILFDQGYVLSYQFNDKSVQGSIKIALKYDRNTKESHLERFKESVHQVFENMLAQKKCLEVNDLELQSYQLQKVMTNYKHDKRMLVRDVVHVY